MRITSLNLDETISLNRKIQKEVDRQIKFMERHLKKLTIHSPEKQALKILLDHNLIRVPIPDPDWGGAIYELPNGNKIPIINTAQPRLYQYFISWHEVYHLTEISDENATHNISTEFDLTERKADYFASQMLISDDIFDYYHQLEQHSFIDRIAFCMDMFKAPYKAILIKLYESAIQCEKADLQGEIKENFDLKYSQTYWETKFKDLYLDDTLIKPTLIVDFGRLMEIVRDKSEKYSDVEVYKDNFNFLQELHSKFKTVKEEWSIGQLQ